jgi:hypothetical protein
MIPLQASSGDDYGVLCRDRRSALSATLLTAWRLKRAVLAWRAMLPKWQSGNNQAPEAGVRGRDPPGLEVPLQLGHNRYERRETTRGKMAAPTGSGQAPSTGSGQAAWGPDSRVRRSPSISVSEQRAPGLAAVRIDRCISVGTIGTDSAHGLCPHSVRRLPPFASVELRGAALFPQRRPPEAAPQHRVVTGAHCAANGAARWRTRKHWPACRRPSGPAVRRASGPRAGSARTIHDHGNPVRGFAVSPKGCTSSRARDPTYSRRCSLLGRRARRTI